MVAPVRPPSCREILMRCLFGSDGDCEYEQYPEFEGYVKDSIVGSRDRQEFKWHRRKGGDNPSTTHYATHIMVRIEGRLEPLKNSYEGGNLPPSIYGDVQSILESLDVEIRANYTQSQPVPYFMMDVDVIANGHPIPEGVREQLDKLVTVWNAFKT